MEINMANDLELQNLLSAVTDALLADSDRDVDAIVGRYAVPRSEVEGLVGIIRRLHLTLVGAQPSRRFVRRLKHELVGETDRNIVARVRYLPPRVQIAAGIALVAGFMLLTRPLLVGLNALANNILEHTAHHVDPRVPLYNLPEAQDRLEAVYPEEIIVERLTPLYVLRILRTCRLYDYERRQWLDYDGTPTSSPLRPE